VACARWPDVPPALVLRRSECLKDWPQSFDWLFVASDHEAVTLFQSPHAAGCAAVHKVKTFIGGLGMAALRVFVVGVSSIDEGVSLLHQRLQFNDCLRHREPRRTQ